jgi:glutamine synthetase
MTTHPYDDFKIDLCDNKVLKERLPFPIYQKWRESQKQVQSLDTETADAIAHAMKTWALERGATHFAHWFQPMTGSTAQKHDAFLEPSTEGYPMARFNGKALIKGEADGSSFPSGGLRATFEARGYTYWDITSPVFIRNHVLCIPSVFVSFNGESLDEKAPLLKSINALSGQATRLLHILGERDVKRVTPVLGQEQEYFIIDQQLFHQRLDLKLTGRTLIGQPPPKGQDSEDHYFGSIPDQVMDFMQDVNQACWKLGIYSKVEHNEVAFNQFEIVPIFAPTHIAIDQNQLIMDILKKTSQKHGLACLLHEKPFVGINGSGKHNNWSLLTNTGLNCFDPKDSPKENIRFLLFVMALLKGIDEHAVLLRMAASSAGNDHRLGANEAPPAIISVYLGDMLEFLLNDIETGTVTYKQNTRKHSPLKNLNEMPTEFADRNRTSPFAFTGTKFEFRMVGSSRSAAMAHTALNTLLADNLKDFCDQLDEVSAAEVEVKAFEIIRETYKHHKRVLFSGDGYSNYWIEEASRRGLANITSFTESIDSLIDPKTVSLFQRHDVFLESELLARNEILHEQFVKAIQFEAKTLLDMMNKQILPAASKQLQEYDAILSDSVFVKSRKTDLIDQLDQSYQTCNTMEQLLSESNQIESMRTKGLFMQQRIRPQLDVIRHHADQLEGLISRLNYPIPTYVDLLFNFD